MAAKTGADFVAPYVNRLDAIAGDGVKLVADIVQIFTAYQLKTEVLAASFKNVGQVHNVCLADAHAATIGKEVTDWSVEQFIADWEKFSFFDLLSNCLTETFFIWKYRLEATLKFYESIILLLLSNKKILGSFLLVHIIDQISLMCYYFVKSIRFNVY